MITHQTKGERYGEAGCLLFFLIPFLCFPIMRDALKDAFRVPAKPLREELRCGDAVKAVALTLAWPVGLFWLYAWWPILAGVVVDLYHGGP